MPPNELLITLTALQKGRQSFVDDFVNEEPRLYRPMFSCEPESAEMQIAASRFVYEWISRHPALFQEILSETRVDGGGALFVKAYRNLCESFISGESRETDKSHILEKLVNDTIEYLDRLLTTSSRASDSLEKLKYQSEKSRHLFDRAIREMKG